MELYQQLGFNENPFSTFSAEEEKSFLKDIYINPLFFETLKADLKKGHSRFIIGARGIGKTALLIRLLETVEQENVFSIIIDQFDGIPSKDNETEIARLIIQSLVTNFSIVISKSPQLLKKLNKDQKEKLAFIIKEFFKTLSKSQYEKYYNKATKYQTRNFWKKVYNYIFNRPINFLIAGGIEIVAETVRKSMGLPSPDGQQFYKNYLPELALEEITKDQNPERFLKDFKVLKSILNDLCEIIKATGFSTSVVFFDKIDEYTKLNSSISAVADFLETFLKDTTVLMNDNYSLVFSIWEVLKPELTNKGVRFDKIKPIDITWQTQNLKDILNRRVQFFSNSKKTIKDIIPNDDALEQIIKLSNNSPRYLFRQLSYIYDQQSEIDNASTFFSPTAISKGQQSYALSFDYYAIYPTKRNSKEDIIVNINRILKIGKPIIKTKDFVEVYKVGSQAGNSYLKIVQEYDLVKQLTETDEGGARLYEVKDPVINHLIKLGVTELKR